MRVATIKDVAQAAGVSVATVSRALNGHSNVTPATRERIVEVAKQMRFTPSSAARSLISRRTHTVGALLPDLYGEYFSELIRGMDLRARAHGLHLLVSSSHGNAQAAEAALRAMIGRVDGLIILSPHVDSASLAESLPPSLPAVLLNTHLADVELPTFSVDNVNGARRMTAHLLERGHRSIAFINGAADNNEAQERLRGYRQALAADSRAQPEITLPGDFTEASGYEAGLTIAALADRPDAVFACNDMMAIGCMSALTTKGLRIPQDIALAGFDDIPIARYLNPRLTTVRVHVADMGGRALDRLAQSIVATEPLAVDHQTLDTEIVVRQSCERSG